MRLRIRLATAVAAVVSGLALLAATSAVAEVTYKEQLGTGGSEAGQVTSPAGIAINDGTGAIYVADRGNNRIEQFTSAGAFVRAWGFDVVASGSDNKANVNEVDEVRVRAANGTFGLLFKGEETAQLAYNATAVEVQSALNALPAVNTGGGAVTVTRSEVSPTEFVFTVTFGAGTAGNPIQKVDLELGIEPSGLGIPAGTQLSCAGIPGSNETQSGFTYQWLANGAPIPGATSATFTTAASSEGKAVQCRATATFGVAATTAVSRPYVISAPAGSPRPPLGPASIAAPSGNPIVESLGGTNLSCSAGTWTRGPETFTYRWYRNGQEIGSPTTTAATSNEYTLTKADVATRAAFQCGVTGNNAGGSSTTVSGVLPSNPKPTEPEVELIEARLIIPPGAASKVIAKTNGGPQFEICKASTVNDICKAGAAGQSAGQFRELRSIAVDGSSGAVYAMDDASPRVQKFTAEGALVYELGTRVDETTEAGLCTAGAGHVCGPGVADTTGAPGGFGASPGTNFEFSELGNQLAVGPTGDLYVSDPRSSDFDTVQSRIQRFSSAGTFLEQAKVPFRFTANSLTRPLAIAVDSGGTAFASLPGEGSAIEEFSPAEFSPSGDGAQRAGNLFDDEAQDPVQLAVDPRNDRLLLSDRNTSKTETPCRSAPVPGRAIIEYDSERQRIDCTVPTGAGALPQVTGIAVSPDGLLYASVGSNNSVKIFELPVEVAPQVGAESVKEITTESAQVHAQINPGFENTTYKVEYGPADCESNPCETTSGGVLRGLKFVDGVTKLSGLEPNTTYHYRVVAENGKGEEVGPDRTFTTFPLVDLVNDPCPNALARKQTKTVGLLDCRAYELASAAFAGGYDVESNLVPGENPYDAYSEAPGRLLYGVHEGGIPGTGKPTNRGLDPYIAERQPDGSWTTRYVGIPSDNPFATSPFASTLSGADSSLSTFAFGGPNICEPCFADESAGVPIRLPNGELVQGMTGASPDPSAKPAGVVAKPLSADGSHLLFGTAAKLEAGANEGGDATIYERDLGTETTEVVSTDEGGTALNGAEVGELDVSADGSRVLVGRQLSVDPAGNRLWHLYLHRAGNSSSTDLMPTASAGAYFDGMTRDGRRVFFTTTDQLLAEDSDSDADIYEAKIDDAGNSDLRLVSVMSDGSASNDETCDPPNEPATWNVPSGEGECGALAFAGGAGVAAADGTFYFLSPEQLDGSEGTKNLPNLYVVDPDESPHFVATIDTDAGKPGPLPPEQPLVDSNFGGGEYENIGALTLDTTTEDVYAVDAGAGSVFRYDSSGAPDAFTAGPHVGNALTGFEFGPFSEAQVGIDNSAGPLGGDLYVTDGEKVGIFSSTGQELGSLDGSSTSQGVFFKGVCGVTTDQSGAVYVADKRGFVWRYAPSAPTVPLSDADYSVTSLRTKNVVPCPLAVDGVGNLYVSQYFEGPALRYETSAFVSGPPSNSFGVEVDDESKALAVDPTTNELYVDHGNAIVVYDSSGKQTGTVGKGKLACGFLGSRGVAVNSVTHHVYASCFAPGSIKEFGYQTPPYTPVDNPAILHAAHPASHSYGDFQSTPDGGYAIFATSMPLLGGYDNASHYEVYRYDSQEEEDLCISCSPTGSQASSDSGLPPNGLGILEDGRVFFNTGEQLTLSDTNEKLDAYEWSPTRPDAGGCKLAAGCRQLISTGTSSYPSGLLGVSSNGVDAFFFTRDTLVGEDHNGQGMKVYDARAGGGLFVVPPPPPCAASDECHGPGSKAGPVPPIATVEGTGGQYEAPKCKKPRVLRKGKCVKKPRRKHHKPKRHSHSGGGSR